MLFSLNCLVLGQASTDIFRVRFGDLVPIGSFNVEFNELTVADFKEVLSAIKAIKGITTMNIWKVELNINEIKNFSTEDDIKKHHKSMKIDNPMLQFNTYYNNVDKGKKPKDGYLHIFVVPTSNLGKKRKVEDISAQLLDKFRKRPRITLPNVEYLEELIDKELPEESKLPLTQREFDMLLSNDINDICSSDDLRVLFRVSETESALLLCGCILLGSILAKLPPLDGTEYSFVDFGTLTFENL